MTDRVAGQIRYSIPEEMKKGSIIGNVAQDLGLDLKRLRSGRARIVSGENIQYTELKTDKGILVVNERIDREQLCGDVTPCSLSFEIILENPIELHRVTVEILDINDNAPFFPNKDIMFETSESATIGAKFPVESAVDPDVGLNALQNYIISPNNYFILKQHANPDGSKYAELVLQKPLDREEHPILSLKVIAVDGGNPQRSGTVNINVSVLDVNDNAPVFNQSVYRAFVVENAPKGTYITTVNATDADIGSNGEIIFSFSKIKGNTVDMFSFDENTGVISVSGLIDFEKEKKYELRLEARDRGGLTGTSKIIIDVSDVNDNVPVINIMSFSNTVSEDAPLGTTVAVINVKDADSAKNGQIKCTIDKTLPFKIQSSLTNYYNLVADQHFDRETISEYDIKIVATDSGSPPLSSFVTLQLRISDVNDNGPLFDKNSYSAYITENNSPGVSVITVSARDSDWNQNARISYFLEDTQISGNPVTNYLSINSETGILHAVRSFDYEQIKELHLTVKAQDGGSPPLSSNVTVKIIIQDQNDNPPQVLYPVQTGGSLVAEMVPRSADVGYLVTKVVAVDVDSGQNAWLSYKLQKATDRALFEVGLQNGEIRTIRQVTDKDAVKQRLTVIVEDNGQPSRSATVIVNVAVADSFPEVLSEFTDFTHDKEYNDNLTFYLVLALAVVSFLFITCLVVIISVKIYRWRQSRILYHSNLPVIPYYPPRYSDTLGTGTLQHVYNYEVCRTTDSRKSDMKYMQPMSPSLVSVDGAGADTPQLEKQLSGTCSLMSTLVSNFLNSPCSIFSFLRGRWQALFVILCLFKLSSVTGQARYSIPEEQAEGSFVGNIARDLGLDVARLISGKARIITKGSRQYVDLNRDKGTLVIKERIDREELCGQTTPCSFSFEVILENPIQLYRVTVEVTDINDNSPSFPKDEINLKIAENAAAGTRFSLESADDPDVGINDIQKYTLKPSDHFKLEIQSQQDGGKFIEMILKNPLDREKEETHSLVLIASDGGEPHRSGTVRIHITVLDVNDNAPVCSQPVYKADVRENSPEGTVVTTVSANDADEGVSSEVTYSIAHVAKEAKQLFEVNSKTGEIKVTGKLDFEKSKTYQLNVKASDHGGFTDTCKVIVQILDENDNVPTIQLMSFSNSISEDSPPGTTIAVVNVDDEDSDGNGVVKCSITSDVPFKIESSLTGYYTIVTEDFLDRESIPEYNITITVSDQGSPPLSNSKNINVKVSDVNDSPPKFKQSEYSKNVPENNSPGLSVFTLSASDADWGQNARVSYFLEEKEINGVAVSSLVSINSENGVVHAVRSFDYEQIKWFEFNVTARDAGSPPLSSVATVKLMIQDQNDNPPQVLYPVQTGGSLVAEMVPRSADVGYLVTKVVAVDVDSGQNAWLSYKLQKATDRALFEVGLQNGEIRTIRQVTDKDAVKQRLTVIVEDNGQPSRSATVIVNVAVADSFPEVLSEFTDFTHDKEYNDNLTFYLVLALAVVSFLFITCLVVIISVKIYRWRQSRILYHSNLPVIPYYPPRYSDTLGTGTLQHVYNYEVCRTTDSRKSDMKYMQPMSPSLVSVDGAEADTPQLEKQLTGTCSQMSTLVSNFLNSSSYIFSGRWQALFVILCLFKLSSVTGQARYSIPEEQAEGSFVGNIARDLGLDVARLISGKARIITKGSRQYVDLNRDKGTLVIKERIDREELCGQTTPCSFSFEVILENPIQLYRVTVEVTDINDNSPSFPKDEINLKIAESVVSGTRFSLESAEDPDVGINDIQKYTLKPSDHFKLEIQSQQDGGIFIEMVLQTPLDREKEETHSLVLIASDGGEPHRSGTVRIHITVLDANDNAPVCSQPVYKADVRENSPEGTVVTTVSANDADEGVSSEVTYSIAHVAKEAKQLFEVNSKTGEIKVTGKLDFEKSKTYQLNVKASDHGGYTDTCKVIVQILDENDNVPTIQLMSFSNSISEDSPPGTTIAVVNVDDEDSDGNGVVKCSINSDVPFKIESSLTGYYTIVTEDFLDRESIPEYNITITVSDQGSPPLSNSKNINVKVSDVNDSPPKFKQSEYSKNVPENNSPGLSVFTLSASDADWGQNARVSYFLEEKEINGVAVSSLVSINSENGVVHAVRSFDYEQIKWFEFNVTARDAGSPPLSSVATVKLMIQDQNDNPPQVLYPVQTGGSLVAEMVPRSADVGYLVTKVVAVDVDSGQNAWLSYKLQKATDRALFEVGLQNGEIRTIRQVTDKDAVKQRLTVIVEDNGQPSRSATVIVNVAVADSFPEVLSEFTDFTHDKEYNDNLTFYLVLALAVVSFLFITCLVVIISVKIYRWRQSRILYHSNLPVIPYYPPRYSDTLGTGTLQHVYNYEVCRTTDSRKSDMKYMQPMSPSLVSIDGAGADTPQVEKQLTGTCSQMSTLVSNFLDPAYSIFSGRWQALFVILCLFKLSSVTGQARYSIPEEQAEGSFVGNIARDLGLDVARLISGKARIITKGSRQYVDLNRDKGTLVIKERIDREELCGQTTPCSFSFEVILENPIQLYRVTVEVTDINDNSPSFPKDVINLKIVENAAAGTRFSLESAEDPDVGINDIQKYTLKPSDHFKLDIQSQLDGGIFIEMVLQTPLDREKEESHSLVLIASDGGEPHRSGTVRIHITVLDANDNAPVCSQPVYKADVRENSPEGTVVTTVSANDADKGHYGEVTYSIAHVAKEAKQLFEVNMKTGEIKVTGKLDFEKSKTYQLNVQASDHGGYTDTCKVIVQILDENDNVPTIQLMSFSNSISEDSPPGTTIAVVNVDDEDSDGNGVVKCSITSDVPFKIESSLTGYYTIVTEDFLDRESIPEYNITITVSDQGSPPLSNSKNINVKVSDVNDSPPKFKQSEYSKTVPENNSPGFSVFTISASDADWGQNARVSYFLEEKEINGVAVSSLVSINSENGVVHAVRSFDYEQIKWFEFNVTARDAGSPPLSSVATVKIIIQDQNDNPPQVLYPVQTGGSLVAEMVPRSADVGYLVTKVVAVDVDSGQNAWLSYKLQKATDRALFEVGLQNGEIRTIRQVTDKDAVKQRLTVIVEDNGQPSRSATVIVNVAVADSFPEVLSEFTDFTHDKEYNDNLTFYLVLALAVVSFLFITCLVVIISVKIYRWRQSRILYHSNLPVIPYYPPRYSDTLGTGTLQHVYNYEVCRTTDSRKSDMKYMQPMSPSLVSIDGAGADTPQVEKQLTGTCSQMSTLVSNFLDPAYSIFSGRWQALFVILCLFKLSSVTGQARYSIPEEQAEGSFVGNIARDLGLDVARLKSGKARIITKGSRQYVDLNRDKGTLVIKERIDREELCGQTTPCSFSFEVILENPIQLYRVTVEVTDINDNSPSFQKVEINLKIAENAALGTRFSLVSADDPDVGINDIQKYTLKPSDHFKLEVHSQPDGGKFIEMVLQTPLDREKEETHSLVLIASDGGEPHRSGTVRIHITVLDVNDNAPVCSQPVYKADVRENSPEGTVVTTVSANDADEGVSSEVTYSFPHVAKEAKQLFEVNSKTGEIKVTGKLDFEKSKTYQLNVQASDHGGFTDTCKVIVQILDENDNVPTIQLMSFSNSISEDSPPGTTIAVVNVDDGDSDGNGVVKCSINSDVPFKIESSLTGYYTIVTEDFLDRESIPEYNITITVSDQGSPPLSNSKNINVKVSDVNDSPPKFKQSEYSKTVPENNSPGFSVFTISASDADWGQNARVSYFLEEKEINGVAVSSLVSINSENGVVHAVRSFDYEQIKWFEFNVTARDAGSPPLSSVATVKIMIQDQNDNPPQVLYPVQTGGSVVGEMVPRSSDVGYLVTKVVAVDVDSGQNAWLSYKLQKATDRALFEVGLQNGEIRTIRQVTDKDAVKQRLTVIVEDNGQPSRSATVIVNVAVADSFPEVLSEFTDFTHDKEYNDNLTFYLVLALAVVSFLFITCLVVIISVKIYRWRQSRILYHSNLPVIPYYPPRYSDTLGTGTLQHVYNYEVCRTTDSRKSDMKYMQPMSPSLVSVDGAEADTPQVEKQLTGTCSQMSTLVSNFLNSPWYLFSSFRFYFFSYLFSDSIKDYCVCTLGFMMGWMWITVCRGRWQALFVILCLFKLSSVTGQARYSIPEEQAEGSFVGNIARDLGLDVARLISGKARIITKGSRQYVDLNRDKGTLVIKERVDREELCGQTTPCSFSFEVILENPIQLYRVTVEVTDINDNSPSFPKDEINLKIVENAALRTRFSLVSADDPDVGINDIQKYTLKPSDNFKLEIQSQADGGKFIEMVLQTPLDREKEETHSLVLIASDGGEPHRSGTVRIHITVLDVNDNAPVCSQPVYKADVRENSPEGTVVTTVSANDADEGVSSEVTYSFPHVAKEAKQLFEVNSKTGEIKVTGKLDFEKSKTYQLNVQASDHGGYTDTCKVIVQILDENDNVPTIQLMSFSNSISEDSPPGTTIAVVNVDDEDSDGNGVVKCSITSDVPFKIESSLTGYYTIVTEDFLDRESIPEYNITITVSDQGSPPLSNSKNINVKVSDVNDSPPKFKQSEYSKTVPENNSPGFSVFTISASDADWGQNARVSYFLEEKEINGVAVSSLVSINSENGVVHAVRSFDYEQIKWFEFNVTARDAGSPPLSSVATVKIMIQDQNDNPPQVLYPVQTGGSLVAEMVPRSADVGYLVTKVVAVDVDSGQNAWLSYKLQKATDRALFEVGLQNGEIRTIRQVTDKDAVKQRLTVIVEDNGQPSRSATVIVNVAVADSFPEVLSEFTDFTHDKEYNDNLTFYLVLALAVVSFLFITCLVVIISVKIYRWRQSRILYHSNLPVIPYYPPRYSDTLGTGTLQHVYNYEVCRTTDSRKSDCKFGTAGSQNVLIMDPSSTGTMQRIQSEKSILDEPDSPLEVRVFIHDSPQTSDE
ncbi:uncharacterized protein LOC128363439 [Scomber japonicus]|uniref:uncharacterized protein LOC128363439 n=1 Tax=Scomber japonicus TaxID=13676 RepID=UPI002306D05B|nr:uncharacterized protein LOC128363439 [Scomber japonicus]